MDELSSTAAAPWAARGSTFSQPGLARPVAWAAPHDLDRLRASHARGRLDKPLVPTSVSSPRLGDGLFARLLTYGTPQQTHRGDVLFRPGDEDVDLIVVDRGSVEVVRAETADVPAATVATVDAGGFVGELNLLTGQNVYLLVPGAGGRHGLPGVTAAPAAAHGQRRRTVRHRLQGADRAPGVAAAQHRRPGGGDRRRRQVGGDAGAADLRRPATPDPPLVRRRYPCGPGDDGFLRPDRGRPSRRRHAWRHAETGHAGRAGREARSQLPSLFHQTG